MTNPIEGLSEREIEVLKLLADGCTNGETALKLDISVKTVEKHRQAIYKAFGIHNTAGLVKMAIRNKLTTV